MIYQHTFSERDLFSAEDFRSDKVLFSFCADTCTTDMPTISFSRIFFYDAENFFCIRGMTEGSEYSVLPAIYWEQLRISVFGEMVRIAKKVRSCFARIFRKIPVKQPVYLRTCLLRL